MKIVLLIVLGAFCLPAWSLNSIGEIRNFVVKDLRSTKKYEVYGGTFQIFGNDKCASAIAQFGNCFGANPAAPYIIPSFELAAGEWADNSYTSFLDIERNGKVFHAVLRQHKTEARVVLVNLPARAAYFGYQSYLFSRHGEPDSTWMASLLPDTYHPNDARYSIFNGLSNPINNVVIAKSLGTAEAWQQGTVAFITTADSKTASEVKDSLVRAGLAQNRIFIESLGDHQQMGLGANHDDFISMIRYALPETEANSSFYSKPEIAAFRVLTRQRNNTAPYVRQALESRGAKSEAYLSSAQNELAEKLKSRLMTGAKKQNFYNPLDLGIDTYQCIDHKRNCLGETRDTDTYFKSAGFQLKGQQIAVIVGVNHTRSGNGTYVSLSVNDDEQVRPAELVEGRTGKILSAFSQAGSAAKFAPENRQLILEGSANRIVNQLGLSLSSATKNNLKFLYVKVLKRSSCGNLKECYHVSKDEARGVPIASKVNLMRRIYLKPGTQRGPKGGVPLTPILNVGFVK